MTRQFRNRLYGLSFPSQHIHSLLDDTSASGIAKNVYGPYSYDVAVHSNHKGKTKIIAGKTM